MLGNVKEFWRKHKVAIITVGGTIIVGTVAYIIGTKITNSTTVLSTITVPKPSKFDADNRLLSDLGAVFKDGFDVPFATKEIAIKFLEDRGNTYQIDILDDLTSVIWISK